MIADSERREVATRLRKAIGLTEFAEVLGFNWTDDSDWVWNDVSNLVADLIEPGEPKVKCVAEVKVDGERLEQLVHDAAVELTGIDRDAERTCRVKSSHEVEGDGCYSYFEYELTCGHEIAWGDQLPPSYCPECGRRVLYDSNDYI